MKILLETSGKNGYYEVYDSTSLKEGAYVLSGFAWSGKPKMIFDFDLSNLEDGEGLFRDSDISKCSINLSKLRIGKSMFYDCNYITRFDSDLPELDDGDEMFRSCDNLLQFNANISKITSAHRMFNECRNLTTFTSDLRSLTNGESMFRYCENLTSFSSDSSGSPVNLSSLTYGYDMFYYCNKLESFNSDLSSLTDGGSMFYDCTNLTSFSSDLKSLTDGERMFSGCKLDTASVQNIADTINTPTSKGKIHIGIGNSIPNEQEEEAFNRIASRNWAVYVGVNGRSESLWTPTAITPIDGEQTTTPIPFYAKPVQSDEQHASYIDSDGNYYNILGGNFIYGDDLSTYGMFVSEEDAVANMRLTKIERDK